MSKIFSKIVAVVVAGAFGFAALFCCYNHPAVDNKIVQDSCCATKTSSKHSSKADCSACPIVKKSVDLAQVFTLTSTQFTTADFVYFHTMTSKPAHAITPVFINGPPGSVVAVPLYIQFHSLRI